MRRRDVLSAALGLAAAPAMALAQTQQPPAAAPREPPPITPQNDLERAFLAALRNPAARPAFRRQLLDSHVTLALTASAPDAPAFELPLREGVTAGLIFTSPARLDSVLGPSAPRAVLTGRAALTRLRGRNVILNARLTPMLTLEAEDVEAYLAAPVSPASAGPTQ